jgi:hypothetical protein
MRILRFASLLSVMALALGVAQGGADLWAYETLCSC